MEVVAFHMFEQFHDRFTIDAVKPTSRLLDKPLSLFHTASEYAIEDTHMQCAIK
jgi:hypothetical protein